MKSRILLAASLVLVSLGFTRCTPESTDYADTTAEIITRGQWIVDYYYAGADHTAQLSSFRFTFRNDGVVEGSNGSTSATGTWSFVRGADRKDLLRLRFTATEPYLNSLNEEWKVTDKNLDQLGLVTGAPAQLRIRKR